MRIFPHRPFPPRELRYLLTQQYLGAPQDLSAATPGFLATSTGVSGGAFVFDSTLTLLSNTKYYLYGTSTFTASGGNFVPGGEAYFSTNAATPFTTSVSDDLAGLESANYILSGTAATAVPEPSTLVPLALLFGAAFFAGTRRRSRA